MDIAEAMRDQCTKLIEIKKYSQAECKETLEQIHLDVCRIKSFRRTARALLANAEEYSSMVKLNFV